MVRTTVASSMIDPAVSQCSPIADRIIASPIARSQGLFFKLFDPIA